MTPDFVQLLFLEVDVLKENGDIINVGRVVALLLILMGPGRNVRVPPQLVWFGWSGFGGVGRWGKLLMLPYVSWQITSSGQTKRAPMQLEGWIFSVFLSFLCFSASLQTTAEGKCRRTLLSPDLERKQDVTSDGKNCSLTSDLCVCVCFIIASSRFT